MFQVSLQQHVPRNSESIESRNEYQMNRKGKGSNMLLGPNVCGEKIISHTHLKFLMQEVVKNPEVLETERFWWVTPCQEKCMRNSQERKSVSVMALSRAGESDYSMLGPEYNAIQNMTFVQIESKRRPCSFLSNNVKK